MDTEKHLPIFDELLPLRDDPEAFNAKADEILEETLARMPKMVRERMRLYDWSIKQRLELHTDPTDRYNAMVEMFWEGFARFQEGLTLLGQVGEDGGQVVERPTAEVVTLTEWRQSNEPSE